MLRKMATLAGSLVLVVATGGEAQERPVARAAVMAKLEVRESVAAGETGTAVEWSGGWVSVSSEWEIAGRVPVVMAAHVRPASVKDRSAARREAREEEREIGLAVTTSAGWTSAREPVSRHTIRWEEPRGGYRVVWYAVVAL